MRMKAKALKTALDFVRKDKSYPMSACLHIEEHENGTYTIVATDNFRLFCVDGVGAENTGEEKEYNLDAVLNCKMKKQLPASVESFEVHELDDGIVELRLYNEYNGHCGTIITRKVDGVYLNYKTVIPENIVGCDEIVGFNAAYMCDGLKAIKTLCDKKKVNVTFGSGASELTPASKAVMVIQPKDLPCEYTRVLYLLMPVKI